ncbi:hypothetical protein CEXT_370341 [Caerostris extrusa]|uniref:Uncharacterized protein n=1 Tax=Caerostris extrusa TaxID=172846 RepID=A0AAV4NGM9_CAEEX|nr:hypothetical protein CEXT_370341 [Caerostris extrusa]
MADYTPSIIFVLYSVKSDEFTSSTSSSRQIKTVSILFSDLGTPLSHRKPPFCGTPMSYRRGGEVTNDTGPPTDFAEDPLPPAGNEAASGFSSP